MMRNASSQWKKHRLELFFLLSLLIFILTLGWVNFNFNSETIKIAIAVPQSHTEEAYLSLGQEMIDGAQFYVDRINQEGGINGKKIELLVYDDQFKPNVAEEVAKEICASSALGILGHYNGEMSLKAGEVYQKCEIPAITGSATVDSVTDNNPWYFRTIFTNSEQARFIAHYIQSVLQPKNVYLITDNDIYSRNLGEEIELYFTAFGETFKQIGSQQLNEDRKRTVDSIVLNLLKLKQVGQEPDLIVLAMQNFNAAQLIRKMRRNGLNSKIVGGDSVGDISLIQRFTDTTEEQIKIGFFTDDIYAVVPTILDISDEKGEKFKNEFELRYGYTPGWVSIFYHDSTRVLIQAIQNVVNASENSSQKAINLKEIGTMRQQVRESLTKINSPATAVKGITQLFYFNEQRNAHIPVLMGVFNQDQFISAFTQLTFIDDSTVIPNLEEEKEKGNLIEIGKNNYLEKTHIVYTGIDINEITHIDEKTSSFLLDFYLWFRYQGDIEPDKIEFTNYAVERLDSGEKLTLDEPIKKDSHDDINHVVYRVKADFHEKFDFHHYPFDKQILSVRFRHHTLNKEELVYVVDFVGIRDTNIEDAIANFKRNNVFDKITDWKITNILFFQDTQTKQSTLGDRRLIKADSQFNYSQFNAEIEIERDVFSFSLKNLLPLWFFVIVAYALLFLPFENISVEAISGLLLAVVFYHLSLLDSLPEGIGYIVALDYAFYLVYFLLGVELVLVILGYNKWIKTNTKITHKQLIQFGRVILPTLWIVGCYILLSIYA